MKVEINQTVDNYIVNVSENETMQDIIIVTEPEITEYIIEIAEVGMRGPAGPPGSADGGSMTGDEIRTALGAASSANDGYLDNNDWITFNNKANDSNVVHKTGAINESIDGIKTFDSIPIAPGYKTPTGTDNDLLLADGTIASIDSVISAGQIETFTWKYSTTTTASNPGNGFFRFDSSNINTVTKVYIDDITSSLQVDMSELFGAIKGNWLILIQQRNDATKFIQFNINDVFIDNVGWWTINISEIVQTGGILPANGVECLFAFINKNPGGITNHEQLDGLLGGHENDHYHLAQSQWEKCTQFASSTEIGLLTDTDWNIFNNKQDLLTSSNFGTFINGLLSKSNPIDSDNISLSDSADSNKQKKISLIDFKTYLANIFSLKLMSAYSFRVNNTNASANSTETTYKSPRKTTYSEAITFTGTTAPSGTANVTYNFVQIDNMVTVTIIGNYSIAGSSITSITLPKPSVIPSAIAPDGISVASGNLYPGIGYISASITSIPSASYRAHMRINASNTGQEFVIIGTANNMTYFSFTITYFTS